MENDDTGRCRKVDEKRRRVSSNAFNVSKEDENKKKKKEKKIEENQENYETRANGGYSNCGV